MAPIHDSDLAEERFKQLQWKYYELWEDIEQRLKKRKKLFILFALVLFFILLSVPIFQDRFPKWQTYQITTNLAKSINKLKREVTTQHVPLRLKFYDYSSYHKLKFRVEKVITCAASQGEVLWQEELGSERALRDYALITNEGDNFLEVPNLVNSFCYDPFFGSAQTQNEESVGFAVIPVKDLPLKRRDRVSYLILTGTSAEISFE
ncbi:MAG: hypothetical protein HY843_07460 [Bdellovibrio sp.]|nr:hypothetical protein [Bdellovibrio sp.]